MNDMCIYWRQHELWDETILIIAVPDTKRYVWMYKHIDYVISNFIKLRLNYYITETSHRTKIDATKAIHKDLKKLLRKIYKHYPVEFGYALKAPCDMHDEIMAKRVAVERLIKKTKGAV